MNRQHWYAVRVRSNFEHKVEAFLESVGYKVFSPTYVSRRRWSDRVKELRLPIFHGYLFCYMDMHNRLPVLQAPGVVSLVGFGKTCVPVPDEEIAAVRRLVDSPLAAQPWPFLSVGDRVRVEEGPLAGLEGLLVDVKSTKRFVLSINLLQRSVAVNVDPCWVRPLKSSVRGANTPSGVALSCD